MATAEIWSRRRLMEESPTSGCSTENGAAGSMRRRRRMEIRRIKMLTNVAQPVSKRLRPISGGVVNHTPPPPPPHVMRHEKEMAGMVVEEEKTRVEEGIVVMEEGWGGGGGGRGLNRGVGNDNDNALASSTCTSASEWGQGRRRGWSVCGVGQPGGERAASSPSTAWERPSGGVPRLGEGNESANASEVVGINSSDRMSSGGSSGSAQNSIEESDVSSSLTSIGGGFQSALGNANVATTRQLSGPPPDVAPTKTVALEESPEVLATMGPAESCGTADMSSTATDAVTIAHVDNQHLESTPSGAHKQQDWQRSGSRKESIPESSAVATDNLAGGSGVLGNCFASNECPSHGMVSLCGRRREMEDAVVSKDSFAVLPCSKVGGCDATGLESAPLHYFGVYDGHGGSQAANFCAERLHKALAEEVESCFAQGQSVDQTTSDWESKWQTAMTQCFKRMDAEVGGFCLEEGECPASDDPRCCPEPIAPETVGTTAIVAVVGACQIIVGNCGDSRAVLSRGGVAIPLSVDHKPEREDEMARVEAAGGRVIYWNGYRVLGVLAMSRAIGDRYLKPYVIAEPEVKCIKRAEDDECLILASDGLWDVMSNEVVCDIARKALNFRRNGRPPPAETSTGTDDESPAAQAAAVLVKLALAKGSSDNISVVVVDLKAPRHR